ncbi:MAG: carbohydrate-binding family 9-like protein [Terriglobia bacterium]|jgi:alpha-galactosidase
MSTRKQLARLVVLIIVFGGSLMTEAAEAPGSNPQTYISNSQFMSKFTAQDFVPDGNLAKPAWRVASWVEVKRDAFTRVEFPQAATEIASLWTSEYVYFAFRCKYTTLNVYEDKDPTKEFWTLWDRDVVEVFLNPQPEHLKRYYEFEVAPNDLWIDLEIDLDKNPFNDPKWDSGFEHATHIDSKDHVWTCEMRIPVAGLKGTKPLEANTEWRLNFFRADGPGNDSQRRFVSWSPVQNDTHSFHSPWSFGVIRFVK